MGNTPKAENYFPAERQNSIDYSPQGDITEWSGATPGGVALLMHNQAGSSVG